MTTYRVWVNNAMRYEFVRADDWDINTNDGYLRFVVGLGEDEEIVAIFPPGKWDYVLTVKESEKG